MACPHLCFLDTVWFQTVLFPLELLKEETSPLEKMLTRVLHCQHEAVPPLPRSMSPAGTRGGAWGHPGWEAPLNGPY